MLASVKIANLLPDRFFEAVIVQMLTNHQFCYIQSRTKEKYTITIYYVSLEFLQNGIFILTRYKIKKIINSSKKGPRLYVVQLNLT